MREVFFCGLENMDVFEKTPWMDSRRPQKKTSRTAAYRLERARLRKRHARLPVAKIGTSAKNATCGAFLLPGKDLAPAGRDLGLTRPARKLG